MSFPRRWLAVALAGLLALHGSLLAAEAIRTWTDASGKFTVEAKIVGFDAGIAKLQREDGSVVALPLERLSAADQEYVRAYDAGNPFRPRAAAPAPNPFLPGGAPSGASAEGSVESPEMSTPPTTRDPAEDVPVDWSAVPALDILGSPGPLTAQIEPAPLPEKVRTAPIKLAPKVDFWDRDPRFLVDGRSQTALLCSVVEGPGRDLPVTAVIQIDLATGASKPPVPMTGVAVHAWDGVARRIVVSQMHKRFDDSLPRTVEVWQVDDKEFLPLFYAVPTEKDRFGGEDTIWAAFLPENRFATLSSEGRLAIWSIDSKQAVGTTVVDRGAQATTSADGSVVAVTSRETVHFFDSRTLAHAGGIGPLKTPPRAIAFSPDGRRFAVAATGGGVWNLADGDRLSEFDSNGDHGFFFADSESVYAGGTVYDAKSGMRILQVRPAPSLAFGHADRVWMTAEGRVGRDDVRELHVALARPLRTDERLEALLAEAKSYLLPPGESIRIDVNQLPQVSQEGIAAKLRDAVRLAGHQVSSEAQIALEARLLVPEEPISIPYVTLKEGETPTPIAPGGFPRPPMFGPPPRPGSFGPRGPGLPGIGPPGFGPSRAGAPGGPSDPATPPPDPYADLPKAELRPPILALRLVLFGEELWTDRRVPGLGYPLTIRLEENESAEDWLASLERGDARHFSGFSVPESVFKPGAWQHPAHGYFKLTLDGLEKDGP